MLRWVLGRKRSRKRKKVRGQRPTYEEAKVIMAKGNVAARRDLAMHEDMEPEILYYLATDDSATVRREIADNDGTPLQADLILAEDPDEEVRIELAQKIGRLIPDISENQKDQLSKMTLEIIEILARDEIDRVRGIISDEIKRAKNVPQPLVRRLAEDVELIVSAPVLEYSPLLGDKDLLEIVAQGIEGGALSAIARRENLSGTVSDAVVETKDVGAVAELLSNETAKIKKKTLEMVAVDAEDHTEWHAPLVNRDNLPIRTIRRIASFVSASLFETLIERNTVEPKAVDEMRTKVRKRIDSGALQEDEFEITTDTRAEKMFNAGKLNDKVMGKAIDGNDHVFVRKALALMADLPVETVAKMLGAGSGKAVTALSWKAGPKVRTSVRLQRVIARVKPQSIVRARDGSAYPMSQEDIEWQLEFFTN
ncbi:MAG: DUF2336 domain-containing protein [Alphaproteobacteria bacterium]|jgi:uncharacterized protein (DUF2336 family)|nr:DUF2336 domain-containing protein [Alphaproteobacteria bacterium]